MSTMIHAVNKVTRRVSATVNGCGVTSKVLPDGEMVIDVAGLPDGRSRFRVPYDIARLAAGRDAFLRQVPVVCECGEVFKVEEEGDLPGRCDKCADAYFTCKTCKGCHHPDDPCPKYPLVTAMNGGSLKHQPINAYECPC